MHEKVRFQLEVVPSQINFEPSSATVTVPSHDISGMNYPEGQLY
jgi:hypothetical protein